MTFIWPAALVTLLLIPLLVAVYLRMQRRRRELAARYGTLGIVQEMAQRPLGRRRHIPPAFFLVGLTVLLVALARPQMVVSLPRLEGTVILAFDVSGSMAADDLEPTRMEAAKAAARAFVARQPATVQIGVVSFSDSGFAVQAPTNEQETVLAAIDRLRPERGTSLAHGILTALNAIASEEEDAGSPRLYSDLTPTPTLEPTPVPEGTYASAVVVLLTDGENTAPPEPLEAAQAAADRGVRVHTVGIGSPEGANLEIEGFTIHTRLDEATLQQISELTDGTYYNAVNEEELLSIYENLDPELGIGPEKMEVTALFAVVSAILLLIGGAYSLFWFSRVP